MAAAVEQALIRLGKMGTPVNLGAEDSAAVGPGNVFVEDAQPTEHVGEHFLTTDEAIRHYGGERDEEQEPEHEAMAAWEPKDVEEEGTDMEKTLEEGKKHKGEFEPLTMLIKEVLGDKTDVIVSGQLGNLPWALSVHAYGQPANMMRIMPGQAVRDSSITMTMEINPKHASITELQEKAATDQSDETVKNLIRAMLEASMSKADGDRVEPLSEEKTSKGAELSREAGSLDLAVPTKPRRRGKGYATGTSQQSAMEPRLRRRRYHETTKQGSCMKAVSMAN